MKLFAVDRMPDAPLAQLPGVDLMVDSSVVLPGRPLFLPPVADEYDIELLPAVRISRLGKNIAAKFASRYYDSMTLLVRVVPRGVSLDNALMVAFDSSVAEGRFIALPPSGEPWTVTLGGNPPVCLDASMLRLDETVALVSRYCTLKHGDIIAPCRIATGVTAAVDTRLGASLNGECVVDLKIK